MLLIDYMSTTSQFAGIYDPNDGKCHTTPGPGGMYTKATELVEDNLDFFS